MDPLMEIEFDLRLQLPNHALFVGASMSGKTQLVLRILCCLDKCLKPVPLTVIFFYDQYQEEYERVKQTLATMGVEMLLREGSALNLEDLEKREHQTLIIIDDATEETASSSDIAKITTNGRHKNVSLWLIWHSLFSKHSASRLITQNVSYLFFLPSVRLTSQLHTLDTQLRYKGALVSSYNQAIEEPDRDHRYLLLDLAPTTPSTFRFRSRVTSEPQALYLR
jgi:hypothetical protein